MVYELFDVLLNSVCLNFVEDFCIFAVILAFSFLLCDIFGYQGIGGLID